jgi:hypothetical protein
VGVPPVGVGEAVAGGGVADGVAVAGGNGVIVAVAVGSGGVAVAGGATGVVGCAVGDVPGVVVPLEGVLLVGELTGEVIGPGWGVPVLVIGGVALTVPVATTVPEIGGVIVMGGTIVMS